MSDPFASAADLSAYTGISTTDLARMQLYVRLASAEIRRVTGQTLSEVAEETVVLAPRQGPWLILPERPVTDVSSVVVQNAPVTDYWFTTEGILWRGTFGTAVGVDWLYGATVVYSHGYPESSDTYDAIKRVCLDAAARAFTLNERSVSEAMGSTLMESAGYAPEVFLTQGEKFSLADLGKVGVG